MMDDPIELFNSISPGGGLSTTINVGSTISSPPPPPTLTTIDLSSIGSNTTNPTAISTTVGTTTDVNDEATNPDTTSSCDNDAAITTASDTPTGTVDPSTTAATSDNASTTAGTTNSSRDNDITATIAATPSGTVAASTVAATPTETDAPSSTSENETSIDSVTSTSDNDITTKSITTSDTPTTNKDNADSSSNIETATSKDNDTDGNPTSDTPTDTDSSDTTTATETSSEKNIPEDSNTANASTVTSDNNIIATTNDQKSKEEIAAIMDASALQSAIDVLMHESKKSQCTKQALQESQKEIIRLLEIVAEKDEMIVHKNLQKEQFLQEKALLEELVGEIQSKHLKIITEKNNQIDQLEMKLHEKERQMNTWLQRLDEARSKQQQDQQTISEIQNQIEDMQKQTTKVNKEKDTKIQSLLCIVQVQEQQITSTRKHLDEMTEKYQTMEQENTKLQEIIEINEKKHNETLQTIQQEMKESMEQLKEEEKKKRDILVQEKNELNQMILEIQTKHDDLHKLVLETTAMDGQNINKTSSSKDYQKVLQQVGKKYNDKKNLWNGMKKEIIKLVTSNSIINYGSNEKNETDTTINIHRLAKTDEMDNTEKEVNEAKVVEVSPEAMDPMEANQQVDKMLIDERTKIQQRIRQFEDDVAAVMSTVNENREKLLLAEEKYLKERKQREKTEKEVLKLEQSTCSPEKMLEIFQESEQEVMTLEGEVSTYKYLNHDLNDALKKEQVLRQAVEEKLQLIKSNKFDPPDGDTKNDPPDDRLLTAEESRDKMELQTLKFKLLAAKRAIVVLEKRYQEDRKKQSKMEETNENKDDLAKEVIKEHEKEDQVKEEALEKDLPKEVSNAEKNEQEKDKNDFDQLLKSIDEEIKEEDRICDGQRQDAVQPDKHIISNYLSYDSKQQTASTEIVRSKSDSVTDLSRRKEMDQLMDDAQVLFEKNLHAALSQKVKNLETELKAERYRNTSLKTSLDEAEERCEAERKLCEQAEKEVISLQIKTESSESGSRKDSNKAGKMAVLRQLRDEFSHKVAVLETELSVLKNRCTTTKDFLKKAEDRYEKERKLREDAEETLRRMVLRGIGLSQDSKEHDEEGAQQRKISSQTEMTIHGVVMSQVKDKSKESEPPHIVSETEVILHEEVATESSSSEDSHETESSSEADATLDVGTATCSREDDSKETRTTDISFSSDADYTGTGTGGSDESPSQEETTTSYSHDETFSSSKLGTMELIGVTDIDLQQSESLKTRSHDSGIVDPVLGSKALVTTDSVMGDCHVDCRMMGCFYD